MGRMLFVKSVHGGLSLLLAWMALVQLNDPDPLYWIGLYALCACVPALALFNRRYPPLNWACIAFCLLTLGLSAAGALEYLSHASEESLVQDMSPDKPYIEIAREFIGTLIALSIVAVYQVHVSRKRSDPR